MLVFEEEIKRVISACICSTWEDQAVRMINFSIKWLLLALGYLHKHVGRLIGGFGGVYDGNSIGKKRVEERRLFKFGNIKQLCVANAGCDREE